MLLDNAQELLKQPKPTESDLLRRFKVTIWDAHHYGLTSIHDAGLDPSSLAFCKRYDIIALDLCYGSQFVSITSQAEIGVLSVSNYLQIFALLDNSENYLRSEFMRWLFSMQRNHIGETSVHRLRQGD